MRRRWWKRPGKQLGIASNVSASRRHRHASEHDGGWWPNLANLHNAKKARSGIVHIVGQHAKRHPKCNAPLTSDLKAVARPMSHWVKTTEDSQTVAQDCAEAIRVARSTPGHIAT